MLTSFLFLIFTCLAYVVVNCSMQHGFIDSLNKGVKFLKNRRTASAGEHNRVIYYSQLS